MLWKLASCTSIVTNKGHMMNEYQIWMSKEEIELYHLDMERSYEDPSYDLDEVNMELQQLAAEGV